MAYKALKGFSAQRLLVFAPHPDDEVFGCGASLALAVNAGAVVRVEVVTDGQLGQQHQSSEDLAKRRESESERAASILGYPKPHFWRYPDRSLRYADDLVQRVIASISAFQPDLVLAPALTEVHPDHRALSQSVLRAAERIALEKSRKSLELWEAEGFDLAFFEVGHPLRANCLIDISSVIDLKRSSMEVFESQLKERPYARLIEALNTYRTYTLSGSQSHAEAFLFLEKGKLSTLDHDLWLTLAVQDSRADGFAGKTGLRVSVIVPSCSPVEVHQSLAYQSYPTIERIAVGDLRLIAPTWRPFFTQLSADECGWSLEQAVAASQGEWLLFCTGNYVLASDHLTRLVQYLAEQGPERLHLFALVPVGRDLPLSESMLVHRSILGKLGTHPEADNNLAILIGGGLPALCTEIAAQAESGAKPAVIQQPDQPLASPASLYSQRKQRIEQATDSLGLIEIGQISGNANRLTMQLVFSSMERQICQQAQKIEELKLDSKALQWTVSHRAEEVHALNANYQAKTEELEVTRSNLERANQAARELQGHVDQGRAFIKQLENDIASLNQDLVRSRQDVENIQADARLQFSKVQSLASELETIRQSRAWRLISAYRQIRFLLKHGRTNHPLEQSGQNRTELRRVKFGQRFVNWLRVYLWPRLPPGLRDPIRSYFRLLSGQLWVPASAGNLPALQALSAARSQWLKGGSVSLSSMSVGNQLRSGIVRPALDIQMILYESAPWMSDWVASLAAQDVSISLMNLIVVDHKSGDGSAEAFWKAVHQAQERRGEQFASIQVIEQDNRGFGAGHNRALRAGGAPWVLVANPDLVFETSSISTVLGLALSDASSVACWELRQKPFEHPKHYDPVSGLTNWCSHACILIRRGAVESIGGWDERLFMYCEDVAMSYRFREAGYSLRYVPQAVVWHHSYGDPHEVKRAQYIGSAVGQIYLRLRFGLRNDAWLSGAILAHRWLTAPSQWRSELASRGLRMLMRAIALRHERHKHRPESPVYFPFRGLDFELRRDGALLAAKPLGASHRSGDTSYPLVSVITRTYGGKDGKKRLALLKQAAACIAQQTWPCLQWIVAEDAALGGSKQGLCGTATAMFLREFSRLHPAIEVTYLPCTPGGRSAAGNAALTMAKGEWIGFLDDDDLLYADHVETLMQAVFEDASTEGTKERLPLVAVYARAFDVPSEFGDPIEEDEPFMHPGHDRSFDPEALLLFNYMPIQSVLFHRCLYERRGGFDPALDYLEDWNLWVRYAQQHRFLYVPKTTSLYRTPRDMAEKRRRQNLLDEAYEPVREKNLGFLLTLGHHADVQSDAIAAVAAN